MHIKLASEVWLVTKTPTLTPLRSISKSLKIKISLLNLAEIPFEENYAAAISHQADVMLSIKLEIVFPLKKI